MRQNQLLLIAYIPWYIHLKIGPIFSYELMCGEGIVGDSVTIKNNRESLTLCEVKVYGDGTPLTGE